MSDQIPIKILHEATGHIVTCETITGEVFRGKLIEAEDNMTCHMGQVTATYRDGRTASLENICIRGSMVRFIILPDMLKHSPVFQKPVGRGISVKSSIMMAHARYLGRGRGTGIGGRGRGCGPPLGRGRGVWKE